MNISLNDLETCIGNCESCNIYHNQLIESNGFYVCPKTGFVSDELISVSSKEARTYTKEEKEKKIQNEPFIKLADRTIGNYYELKNFTSESSKRIKRALKIKNQTSQIKNLKQGYMEIEKRTDFFNIKFTKYVKELAKKIYKSSIENISLKGKNVKLMFVASLYLANQQGENSWGFNEFLNKVYFPENNIKKRLYACVKQIEIEVMPELKIKKQESITKFVAPIISKLNLSQDLETKIFNFFSKKEVKIWMNGKKPQSIIAGAIYYVSRQEGKLISEKKVAKAALVTEKTVS